MSAYSDIVATVLSPLKEPGKAGRTWPVARARRRALGALVAIGVFGWIVWWVSGGPDRGRPNPHETIRHLVMNLCMIGSVMLCAAVSVFLGALAVRIGTALLGERAKKERGSGSEESET